MKAQLRPIGLVLRCQGIRNETQIRPDDVLRQRTEKKTHTQRRLFTSAISSPTRPKPSPLARSPCRLPLGHLNRWQEGRLTRRAPFSTSTIRRVPKEDEAKSSSDEAKEDAQGSAPSGGKPVYPERLLIYHAGTGKTTFLACLKLTTLFVFGFFDMIVAPTYISAGEPLMKTAGVALCGIIPAAYVAWTTSPFVAAMHLHLPPYARWSPAILERFARTAPPGTRLDVTTMSLIGKPRVSSMTLADLRPARRRLGTVNYARDTSRLDATRKWWRFRAVAEFSVQEGAEKRVKTGWVWRDIRDGIAKRAAAQAAAAKQ
ncbi:uncharacterized protein P884DRAFT_255677 [Thermothelomyces heterothallicus CBS 202.75]|uniref:uncharacterized protein n=1 Tax=Thermothelomyces heterothallicus CBS 202.75 TaxID=1149848 RepID=UPI003743A713